MAWCTVALLPLACADPADHSGPVERAAQGWFVEESADRGVEVRYARGASGNYYIVETMGGGTALLDYDDDGDLDLYLVQGGSLDDAPGDSHVNRLLENTGQGRFVDRTAGSGAGDGGYGIGVATGDFDGDGDIDLYVTNLGRNTLLRNEGGGRFLDVTEAAAVEGPGFSACSAFADVDGDGDLDLFVTSYLDWTTQTERVCFDNQSRRDYCNPEVYDAPMADMLYLNEGDGTFRDASIESGMAAVRGTGLGVAIADVSGDDLPDIFVANDGMPDRLWINQGDGLFIERGMQLGCAVDDSGKEKAGMGADLRDVDRDGDLDVLVTNLFGETDSLFINDGGVFVDGAARWGIAAPSRPYTGWGMALADFDNDGLDDLFVATGRVRWQPDLFSATDPLAEPDQLYRQGEDGRFIAVTPRGGTAASLIAAAHGVASGDIDGDGGVDLIVVNKDASVSLLRNIVPDRGNWVMLDVRTGSGAPAIGAVVTLELPDGTRPRRVVRTSRGYASAHDPRIHVGLGDAETIASVVVRWPSGDTRTVGPLAAGRVHVIAP